MIAASAGRSIPGMVRSAILLIAISAPVLPALTAAPAAPVFTALTARPMLVVLARRIARLGSSSPPTTSSQWRISDAARRFGWFSSAASMRGVSPTSRNLKSSWRRRASAAPSTITRTPTSPPIASTAIRGRFIALLSGLSSGPPAISRRRRPDARYSGRSGRRYCAGASARRSCRIHRRLQPSANRANDACRDGWAILFSWGQPWWHHFLK